MKSGLTPSEMRLNSRRDKPDRVRPRNGLPTINRRCSTRVSCRMEALRERVPALSRDIV